MTTEASLPANPPTARENLKILIAATPKTGNIWLKQMLATAYGLRILEIKDQLSEQTLAALGTGWVAHQHISPTAHLISLLEREGVIVLTVLRHPCDVLVSLKAYLGNIDDASDRERNASAMLADGNEFGSHTLRYVKSEFAAQVNLSLLWWKTGAIPVRYEDLLRDTAGTLRSLAAVLGPPPEARLKTAIAQTNFNRMRRQATTTPFHFRSGSSGGWRDILPKEMIDVFRHTPPYPKQFAALRYHLEPDPPKPPLPPAPESKDPFADAVAFDNGAAISDVIILFYFESCAEPTRRWPDPTQTAGEDSFLNWLNSPCESDPLRNDPPIVITTLAYCFYRDRPDLQRAFPDVFGLDRISFSNWFLICAMREYDLDLAFVAPTLESIATADSLKP